MSKMQSTKKPSTWGLALLQGLCDILVALRADGTECPHNPGCRSRTEAALEQPLQYLAVIVDAFEAEQLLEGYHRPGGRGLHGLPLQLHRLLLDVPDSTFCLRSVDRMLHH